MIQILLKEFLIFDWRFLIITGNQENQKSQIKNLKSLYHAHRGTAFGRAGPLDLVHESANQEVAASGSLENILRRGRIGDAAWIKTLTLIFHLDFDGALSATQRQFDLLGVVFLVSVHDRVGDCFAHGHVDSECRVVSNSASTGELSRRGGSIGNSLNVAGQNESSRLIGHKRRGLP